RAASLTMGLSESLRAFIWLRQSIDAVELVPRGESSASSARGRSLPCWPARNIARLWRFGSEILHERRSKLMAEATDNDDHDANRKWAEARDGRPARVKASGDGGILRIDFGEPEESLEEISWDDFFTIFDENGLAFLHQDETEDGKISR